MGGPPRRPYDYATRVGVRWLTWDETARLAETLAEQLEHERPAAVIAVARAGVFPGLVVAAALRRELLPVRVSRRVDSEVAHEHPIWRLPVPDAVAGKAIAVVDEIADTGETLELVRRAVIERGASRVVTAALAAHTWADPQPDVVGVVSDELLVFPWDDRVLANGSWVPNPEVEAAIRAARGG